MCYQTSVLDRALVSDEGGGLDVPGTDLDTIEDLIAQLGSGDLKQVTKDAIKWQNQTSAVVGLLVAELDRRQLPEIDERLSTTGWLKHHTRMTATEASGTLKTARAMAHMPAVVQHALAGDVPARSLHLIAQARDKYPDEFVDHQEVFADASTYLSVTDMRRAINHWEQQINYPKALQDAEHVDKLRSLYLAQTIDGIGDIRGTLTPGGYATIKAALDAHSDPFNLDPDDRRTPSQRRADALVDIHRFWLDHNTNVVTSGGEKPHITVTVDYRTLTGELHQLPEMNGVPVTPETIRQMTCDAAIIPVVLGSDSEPLDVGRKTRVIPPAIRRAIEQLHGGCAWPGCDAPLSWCDIHHKVHWADGGETSLKNCLPYCRKHHTCIHNGQRPPDP
jgi:hypothetical protein